MTKFRWWVPGILALGMLGCQDPDRPVVPGVGAGIYIDSDPRGASIRLNQQATGRVTPDTLQGIGVGLQSITVLMESDDVAYGFSTSVTTTAEQFLELNLPLLMRCDGLACYRHLAREKTASDMRMNFNPAGMMLFLEGQGSGLSWPAATNNSYASVGSAVFAGVIAETGDTVALGPYDTHYLAGRPGRTLEQDSDGLVLRQEAWVVPPPELRLRPTVRGLAIEQEVIARSDQAGVVLVRLVFRNITNQPSYRAADPVLPSQGITFESVYIGFALDGDVEDSNDDFLSYEPEYDLAFIYDSDFLAPGFSAGWSNRPGLIGVRALEVPAGTTTVLNGWVRELGAGQAGDWVAGTAGEVRGLSWLMGTHTLLSNHPDPRIGFVPTQPADMRASVSAGPLQLAPGDSATLTVAVVLAPPADGSFVSGTSVSPGDPTNTSRTIRLIAEPLVQRALAAETLLVP